MQFRQSVALIAAQSSAASPAMSLPNSAVALLALRSVNAVRSPLRIRPPPYGLRRELKMENRTLPAMIGHIRVIAAMEDVEHDGARTEVERHTAADEKPLVA